MNKTHHDDMEITQADSGKSETNSPCCGSTKHCHCHHFWMWAIVRIIIVLALIVGAFFCGIRIGMLKSGGFDNYQSDWNHRGRMIQGDYKNNRILPGNIPVQRINMNTNSGSNPISNTGARSIRPINSNTGTNTPIR